MQPDDVDRILGEVNATTCVLDPCPSWLIKAARGGMADGVREVVNASLQQGRIPACLKEAVIRPLLKKPSLDPSVLDNYWPVSHIPFLGNVLEFVVVSQLQGFLKEVDYLDPFQSGFRPGYGTDTALVALVHWFLTLGYSGVLDCNSQKPSPPTVPAGVSGSCSSKTSE